MLKKKLLSKRTPKADRDPEKKRPVYLAYKILNALLPIGLLILIRVGLVELSILIALFSKWRVFAVKPRHMLANLRSNSVDIIVKVSTLAFIIDAEALGEQLVWTAWYILWLTVIKPASSKGWMAAQAMIAHLLGVSAVFLFSNSINDVLLLLLVWFVALSSARHFISSYEENKTQIMAQLWALFVVQLAWVLNKWLLVYVFVPQLIFIIAVVGYALASVYDAFKRDVLKVAFVRQQAITTLVILALLMLFADWQGNI